jgi:NAD+ kinase
MGSGRWRSPWLHDRRSRLRRFRPCGTCPPLVVGCESSLRVTIEPGYYGARAEVDGHVQELPSVLSMRWQPNCAKLVAFAGAETLLAGLRRRRILMDSPRVLARDDRAGAITRR